MRPIAPPGCASSRWIGDRVWGVGNGQRPRVIGKPAARRAAKKRWGNSTVKRIGVGVGVGIGVDLVRFSIPIPIPTPTPTPSYRHETVTKWPSYRQARRAAALQKTMNNSHQ